MKQLQNFYKVMLFVFVFLVISVNILAEAGSTASTGVAGNTGANINQGESSGDIKAELAYKDNLKYFNKKKIDVIGSNFLRGKSYFSTVDEKKTTVQPDYLLKPGDEIVIDVWGDLGLHYNLAINDEGFLVIPKAGRVSLNGVSFNEAKKKIINKLADVYSFYIDPKKPGAGKAIVDIAVGKITGVHAYVTGEVVKPGSVKLKDTYSSILAAISKSGGIAGKASVRNIKLKKIDGKEYVFDLYNFLFKGSLPPELKYLNDGDMVFVPMRGKLVNVTGSVYRPGLYEIRDNEKLSDLIALFGGLLPNAMKKIKILRIKADSEGGSGQEILLFNAEGDLSKINLEDGDTIIVNDMPKKKLLNLVYAEGAGIKTPGEYNYINGMTIKDLIGKANGIYPDVYYDRVDIVRTNKDFTTKVLNLNLNKILEGNPGFNIKLQPLDRVIFYSNDDMRGNQYVSLEGHVKKPGKYRYHDNLSLYDLLIANSGLTDLGYRRETYLSQANIIRRNAKTQKLETIPFDLGKLLNGDMNENIPLQNRDVVKIYSLKNMYRNNFVTIVGEVKKPGKYQLDENMNLNALIIESGGFKDDAMSDSIEIGRKAEKNGNTIKKVIDIDYNIPSGRDYPLQKDDYIIVKSEPYAKLNKASIIIGGEVRKPGTYNYTVGERIDGLIRKAGGLKPGAFIDGAEFYRDGKLAIIDLDAALKDTKSNSNFVLYPGDKLNIPKLNNFVDVKGAVVVPSKILYKEGEDASYYIDKAGGYIEKSAEKYETKIINPKGYVEDAINRFLPNPEVSMGSTINVPVKPGKE